MELTTTKFLPNASESREALESLQLEIAATADFTDSADSLVRRIDAGDAVIAGIDQAFLDGGSRAISAIVVLSNGEIQERVHAVSTVDMAYIPGLLAFREGPPIIKALQALETVPDVLIFDGSGRIHFREAGIATHIGVLFDVPAIGVTKNLLCGTPEESLDGLSEESRVSVTADNTMTTPSGTIVGYAYQSRQFPDSKRINPIYVSPGHRVAASTAVDIVAAVGGSYKLPKPIRLADSYAAQIKATDTPEHESESA